MEPGKQAVEQLHSSDPRFELAGEVICSDVTNSRAINRFVQKRIGQWIASRFPGAKRSECRFHVTFDHEGSGHLIGCVARVRIANKLWTGADYGDSLSESLILSLAKMKSVVSAHG